MLDGVDVDPFPRLQRWLDAVAQRPATLKAYELAKSYNRTRCGSRKLVHPSTMSA
jgi:glutathione S-transferase